MQAKEQLGPHVPPRPEYSARTDYESRRNRLPTPRMVPITNVVVAFGLTAQAHHGVGFRRPVRGYDRNGHLPAPYANAKLVLREWLTEPFPQFLRLVLHVHRPTITNRTTSDKGFSRHSPLRLAKD